MTYPAAPAGGPRRVRIRPDAGQFWAGIAATALVAALVALVGILICRWTLGIPILAPSSDGAWGNAHTGVYILVAACVALVAGALYYLLTLGTPDPRMFFGWIIGLATLVAVVYPFSTGAPLDQKAATAIVNLAIGVAIGTLLTATAVRSVRREVIVPPRDRAYDRERPYDADRYDRDRADRYDADRAERYDAERAERYDRDRRHDPRPTQPIDYDPYQTRRP